VRYSWGYDVEKIGLAWSAITKWVGNNLYATAIMLTAVVAFCLGAMIF